MGATKSKEIYLKYGDKGIEDFWFLDSLLTNSDVDSIFTKPMWSVWIHRYIRMIRFQNDGMAGFIMVHDGYGSVTFIFQHLSWKIQVKGGWERWWDIPLKCFHC